MSKSKTLVSNDIRKLFQIVGECRDLGDDLMAWRLHLGQEVAQWIGAGLAVVGDC